MIARFILIAIALSCGGAPRPSTPSQQDFLTAAVDARKDPRHAFYDWATGAYRERLQIPPDRGAYGYMNQTMDTIDARLEALIVEASAGGDFDERLIHDFWQSGLAAEKNPGTGIAPLQQFLAGIDRIRDVAGVVEQIAHLHRIGVTPLFEVSPRPDLKQTTRHRLRIDEGTLGLGPNSRSFYSGNDETSKKFVAAYELYIAAILTATGSDRERAQREAQIVLSLERAVAEATTPLAAYDPATSHRALTMAELASLAPGIDWPRFVAQLGAPKVDTITTLSPAFLTTVARLIATRPVDEWKAYLRFRLVSSFAAVLGEDLRAAHFALYGQTIGGQRAPRPWRKTVVGVVSNALGEPIGRLYIRHHVPPALEKGVREVVRNVKQTFRDRLAKNRWMRDETRRAALEKLDRMTIRLIRPDAWARDYKALRISPTDFVANIIAARMSSREQELAKLHRPVSRDDWGPMMPQTWTAVYDFPRNTFTLTASYLYFPGFDPERPDIAYLYGMIGTTVAHEITHGFDSIGRKFDADGNARDWWHPDDARTFETMTAKLVTQFSAYKVAPGVMIDGKQNLPENLAELAGVTVAFEAFRQTPAFAAAKTGGLTPAQRFFVGWSLFWSGKFRDEYLRKQAVIDPHTPPPWGVDGIAEHVPGFHETFATQRGHRMYRAAADRVTLW